jgi:hypothetical protein
MRFLMDSFGVEYALFANVLLSLAFLLALTLLSLYYLRGFWIYLPLLSYSALRLVLVVVNYKVLLGLFS